MDGPFALGGAPLHGGGRHLRQGCPEDIRARSVLGNQVGSFVGRKRHIGLLCLRHNSIVSRTCSIPEGDDSVSSL